jgi:hypothetical protein
VGKQGEGWLLLVMDVLILKFSNLTRSNVSSTTVTALWN